MSLLLQIKSKVVGYHKNLAHPDLLETVLSRKAIYMLQVFTIELHIVLFHAAARYTFAISIRASYGILYLHLFGVRYTRRHVLGGAKFSNNWQGDRSLYFFRP